MSIFSPCCFSEHLSAPHWPCPYFSPGSPHTGTPPRHKRACHTVFFGSRSKGPSETAEDWLEQFRINKIVTQGKWIHNMPGHSSVGCANHRAAMPPQHEPRDCVSPCQQSGGWWRLYLITGVYRSEHSASGGCCTVSEPMCHQSLWASMERGKAWLREVSHGITHNLRTRCGGKSKELWTKQKENRSGILPCTPHLEGLKRPTWPQWD